MVSHLYFVGANEGKEHRGKKVHKNTHTNTQTYTQIQPREKLQRCNTQNCIRFILLHISVTRDAHIQLQVQIHVDAVT